MGNIRNLLSQINLSGLIKLFNIQIAIAIFLIFLIFRKLFSQIVLKIVFKITKNKVKVKESGAYKILNHFFIFLGLYCSIRMLDLNYEIMFYTNQIFEIICIIFITNIVNSNITKDAKWFKHSNNDIVNNFICKIIRGVIWIISSYIILKVIGFDLTGLVAGFGVGSVIISLAAQDTVKSLLSRCDYYDRQTI